MENFYKIDNLLHHGFQTYYLKIEDVVKATVFNDTFLYYYKSEQVKEGKLLGRFLGKDIYDNSYVFEYGCHDNVFTDGFIYCMPLPPTLPKKNGRNLIPIQNFTYLDYPVYVHCEKENN
jgi:hypothetical protein